MSKNLNQGELQNLIELLREHMNVFTWNYKNILGPNMKIDQYEDRPTSHQH